MKNKNNLKKIINLKFKVRIPVKTKIHCLKNDLNFKF